jgi:hypothetical protein
MGRTRRYTDARPLRRAEGTCHAQRVSSARPGIDLGLVGRNSAFVSAPARQSSGISSQPRCDTSQLL